MFDISLYLEVCDFQSMETEQGPTDPASNNSETKDTEMKDENESKTEKKEETESKTEKKVNNIV